MTPEETRREAEAAFEKFKEGIPGSGFPLPTGFEKGFVACYGIMQQEREKLVEALRPFVCADEATRESFYEQWNEDPEARVNVSVIVAHILRADAALSTYSETATVNK